MTLLSPRFRYDGKPSGLLSQSQKDAIQAFREEISQGLLQEETVECFCGVSEGEVIAEKDAFGINVRTVICPSCGLMRSNPRLTEASAERFYRDFYRHIYEENYDPQTLWLHGLRKGAVLYNQTKRYVRKGTVLDIGCAAGGVLEVFRRNGFECYGCDFEENALKVGRSAGLHLINGRAEEVAALGVKADILIVRHVIEHILDLRGFLSAIRRLVNEGGYLYVGVPGIFEIYKDNSSILYWLQNAHVWHFTLDTLSFVMSKYGFELVRGDEAVNALFQLTNRPKDVPALDVSARILKFLESHEQKLDQRAPVSPREYIRRCLGSLGLLDIARRVRRGVVQKKLNEVYGHDEVKRLFDNYLGDTIPTQKRSAVVAHLVKCELCLNEFILHASK